MVKVRQDRPLSDDGRVDIAAWVGALGERVYLAHPDRLRAACEMAWEAEDASRAGGRPWPSGVSSFETGLEMADILADLRVDQDGLTAAVLYRAVREEKLTLARVEATFNTVVAGLIEGVLRMAAVNALQLSSAPRLLRNPEEQIENVRKMLVALVDDVRVALIKLAERTCIIRSVKAARVERRERVAREVFDVYAPLAHRLGIGQLRWELEDLSFRYLQPEAYRRIATLLKERREARQAYIDNVITTLSRELAEAGIEAEIHGRPKHIYSIWRKMQQKGVDFGQIYDVRAVRVLVGQVRECYAVLGVLHALWRHVPHEFDDYIATPKENAYRSIHTAVIGPEGKHLEVQIRTREMHEEAELGVCAHWIYKGNEATSDRGYEEKVAWLRQVLEWQEELGDLGNLGESLRRDFDQERIYVLTPEGHVLGMAPDSTPLDFAYRVHTEVGHRCRAARVDGRIVPLNYALRTGEKVEILTDDDAEPSPSWLNPNLGFLRTSRARAKVQAFFRTRDRERNVADGRVLVLRELLRMAISPEQLPKLAEALQLADVDELFCAVGAGDLIVSRVLRAAEHLAARDRPRQSEGSQLSLLPSRFAGSAEGLRASVRGVGNRAVELGPCCGPQPGDAIAGEVTEHQSVIVHRRDCPFVQRLARERSSRTIVVNWGSGPLERQSFDVRINAYNRPGLLHEVSAVFADERVDVLASTAMTDRETSTATIEATLEVDSLEALGRIMDRIGQIPNVIDVCRTTP